QIQRAVQTYERLIATGSAIGGDEATRMQASTFHNIGLIHADFLDSDDVAIGYYRQAIALLHSIDEGAAIPLHSLGIALQRQGKADQALAALREAAAAIDGDTWRLLQLRIDSAIAALDPALDAPARLAPGRDPPAAGTAARSHPRRRDPGADGRRRDTRGRSGAGPGPCRVQPRTDPPVADADRHLRLAGRACRSARRARQHAPGARLHHPQARHEAGVAARPAPGDAGCDPGGQPGRQHPAGTGTPAPSRADPPAGRTEGNHPAHRRDRAAAVPGAG